MTGVTQAHVTGRNPIDAILDQSNLAADRTAALGTAFELFANNLSTRLREWSSTFCGISIGEMEPAQINARLREYNGSMCARLKIGETDTRAWMLLEPAAGDALMAAAFGSALEATGFSSEPTIETALISRFFEIATGALNATLGEFVDGDYSPGDIFRLPDEMEMERRDAQVISIICKIGWSAGGGALVVLLPAGVTNSMRPASHREATKEQQGADGLWADEMKAGVDGTKLLLRAVVDRFSTPLEAISKLRAGSVMELRTASVSDVVLHCGEARLFSCELGQEAGRYTLRVRRSLGSGAAMDGAAPARPGS